ncbi:MAG: diacylglycerol kinase family lipid kinase [Planctomycetes bacterium]|nr:diacylglycerol kinase family lipid kinase [Planctomycetota bacterium]
MKVSIILNPYSGGRRGRNVLAQVLPILQSASVDVTISETTHAGHALSLAREINLKDLDGIVTIGGDGTLNEVVNGMLSRKDKQKIPIGVIPGGSGNAFAHDLGLLNPQEAAQAILGQRPTAVDAIRVELKGSAEPVYALNILGWGLVTDIGLMAQKLRWLGERRYTLVTVMEIFRHKARPATLILEDREIVDDFTFVIVCNTIHTGKGMKIAPKARLDDGLMDVVVVREHAKRIRLLKLFAKLFEGKHIEDPLCEYYQVRRCALLPEKEGPLNLDGDIMGRTPVRLEVIPKAFSVFSKAL